MQIYCQLNGWFDEVYICYGKHICRKYEWIASCEETLLGKKTILRCCSNMDHF